MIQVCTSVYSEFILVCIQFERLHCNTVERILYSESHSIKHRNRYASHLFLPPKFACPITRLTCFLPPQSTFWRTKWYCKYFFLKCFLSPKLALNCHKNIFHCLQINCPYSFKLRVTTCMNVSVCKYVYHQKSHKIA